jgi:CRP-like cAMP-binding protein
VPSPLPQLRENFLLNRAPAHERASISQFLDPVTLGQGAVIYRADGLLKNVYFPTTCVLSPIILMRDGSSVETGTVGREGIGGVHAALGVRRIRGEMICQVKGEALAMPLSSFVSAVAELEGFRVIVHRYIQFVMDIKSQSIACNRLHTLPERCARWLLMTRDRVGKDDFFLTQEFLAYMLGVQRPGVSIAAGALQQAGFIAYSRGHIRILDREGLESASCECYRALVDNYERLMGDRS